MSSSLSYPILGCSHASTVNVLEHWFQHGLIMIFHYLVESLVQQFAWGLQRLHDDCQCTVECVQWSSTIMITHTSTSARDYHFHCLWLSFAFFVLIVFDRPWFCSCWGICRLCPLPCLVFPWVVFLCFFSVCWFPYECFCVVCRPIDIFSCPVWFILRLLLASGVLCTQK